MDSASEMASILAGLSVWETNGEQATARGVFGVPTFVTPDGELFWGEDATDMLLDYLSQAPVFDSDEMRRADHMPMAAQRIPLVR